MQTPAFAEEAVLGGVMLRNELFHEVAALLSTDHFTSPFRRRVWTALRDRILAGEPADGVTVGELMPDGNTAAAVIDLCTNTFSAAQVPAYAEIVRKNWRDREGGAIAQRLLAGIRSNEDGAVDEAIGALLNLNSTQTECEFTGKQAMLMAWEQANKAYENGGRLPGITTGLSALNDILGGWHDSDLTIIGARPAMGKTALMVGLAEASSADGVPTGLISAEQPANQLGIRRLSLASSVGAANIRAGRIEDEGWARMNAGVSGTKDRPMWIYDRSAVTLDELVGVARKWKHTHGIGILFIDYAQRITVPGADRITEVATIARGLKNLARNLQIPVVSLAQVKAAVDTRIDRRPTAGDLANSDELTREADQILMLYRDQVYNRDSQDRGIAEILIEKNRHGPTGFKRVSFHEETMRFADLAYEDFR
jgi:replicative DNA helicase